MIEPKKPVQRAADLEAAAALQAFRPEQHARANAAAQRPTRARAFRRSSRGCAVRLGDVSGGRQHAFCIGLKASSLV
jgi:hypothetical protein